MPGIRDLEGSDCCLSFARSGNSLVSTVTKANFDLNNDILYCYWCTGSALKKSTKKLIALEHISDSNNAKILT